jgi:hypothetical protein
MLEECAISELVTALDNLHDLTCDYDAGESVLDKAWSRFERARKIFRLTAIGVDTWDQDPVALAWLRSQNALSTDLPEIDPAALVACLDEPLDAMHLDAQRAIR